MNNTDVAYLAGIIDGEGCISVSANYKNGRNYYRLLLDITNTNYELMQWIEDTFGGNVRTSYARKQNRSDMNGWTVSGVQCQELLSLVSPYLIVKSKQTELVLGMHIADYGGSSRDSYSKEEEINRQRIREGIMALNRKNGNKGSYNRTKSNPEGGEFPTVVSLQ